MESSVFIHPTKVVVGAHFASTYILAVPIEEHCGCLSSEDHSLPMKKNYMYNQWSHLMRAIF